jgi:hypothetical protein
MKRLPAAAIAIAATAATVGAFLVVAVAPASAKVKSPPDGSTIRGQATLTASPGGSASGYCSFFGYHGRTDLDLINSADRSVYHASNDGGPLSRTITTENYPNGQYKVEATKTRVASNFLVCKARSTTYDNTVTIDNVVSIAYTGAGSAPANTSATVTAYVKDPNLNNKAVSGIKVTFQLSNGASVSGRTGPKGGVSRSLPINGPARSATLTVSTDKTPYYDANSTNVTFNVTKDATKTAL